MENQFKQSAIDFSHNLIKGRIAETLFEQMLRDYGEFTVLAFGYENIIPELAHRQNDIKAQETMDIIRRAPDFAIINHKNHEVFLVEVKYMMHPKPEYIFDAAKRIYESWKPSYLFLSTPKGFFFNKASAIIERKGEIDPFREVPKDLQEKYLELLNKFISVK